MRREFGGCAGNIAYNLKLLGGDPIPMATVGQDFGPYRAWFTEQGIRLDQVKVIDELFTPQAFITTDHDNNQITAFHPGAMSHAHEMAVPPSRSARSDLGDLAIGIIAPDGRDAMWQHARQMHEAGIPFVFDPGQQLPQFNNDEHRSMLAIASWVAVNDYEARMLQERTGQTPQQWSERANIKGVVVTLAEQGCELWQGGQRTLVRGVAATEVVDPTGCGDAFRAALLYGLERGWPLQRCAELGNRLGALKIAQRGPQNHQLDSATRAML